MELLDRYLQAVRFFLPRAQQDDIVRELSENLHSAIEDREGDLGRPLTEDELAALLRAHGHPMMVAGRYRSNQQLIGPTFFPIYVFALKAGLGIALLVTVVLLTIETVMQGNAGRHLLEAFLAYPGRALMVFAWTTLGFAALDWARTRVKLTHSWDPRTLPAVVAPGDAISRTRSICEFLLVSAATIWLAMLPWAPAMIFGPAAAFIAPGPVWSTVYSGHPADVVRHPGTARHQCGASVLDADAGISPRGTARGRRCRHAGPLASDASWWLPCPGRRFLTAGPSRLSSRCSTRWDSWAWPPQRLSASSN